MPTDKERRDFEALMRDVNAEKEQAGKDYYLDERIQAIEDIVKPILENPFLDFAKLQILLCNAVHREPAGYVARQYGLELVCSLLVPENEVLVCSNEAVEKLIKSRKEHNEN